MLASYDIDYYNTKLKYFFRQILSERDYLERRSVIINEANGEFEIEDMDIGDYLFEYYVFDGIEKSLPDSLVLRIVDAPEIKFSSKYLFFMNRINRPRSRLKKFNRRNSINDLSQIRITFPQKDVNTYEYEIKYNNKNFTTSKIENRTDTMILTVVQNEIPANKEVNFLTVNTLYNNMVIAKNELPIISREYGRFSMGVAFGNPDYYYLKLAVGKKFSIDYKYFCTAEVIDVGNDFLIDTIFNKSVFRFPVLGEMRLGPVGINYTFAPNLFKKKELGKVLYPVEVTFGVGILFRYFRVIDSLQLDYNCRGCVRDKNGVYNSSNNIENIINNTNIYGLDYSNYYLRGIYLVYEFGVSRAINPVQSSLWIDFYYRFETKNLKYTRGYLSLGLRIDVTQTIDMFRAGG
ncbi:MAG: hypothetical protein K9I85_11670 [Saprospiraceae bacterium]|nr:hypothetical protein [Saprospiraceae bacterium]